MAGSSAKTVVYGAIAANVAIAITKFTATFFTGSASIAIGLLLIGMALFLLKETRDLLVGEGVNAADPAVRSLRPPLYLGPADTLLALDVCFQQDLTAQQVEDAVGRLEKAIRAKHPEFRHICVEAESFAPKQRVAY